MEHGGSRTRASGAADNGERRRDTCNGGVQWVGDAIAQYLLPVLTLMVTEDGWMWRWSRGRIWLLSGMDVKDALESRRDTRGSGCDEGDDDEDHRDRA